MMLNGLPDAVLMITECNSAKKIQLSAENGNTRAMYDGMKKAFGPRPIKLALLKSSSGQIITDRNKQMERRAEHYLDFYSRENTLTNAAMQGTVILPVIEELDTLPTIDELSKAIDSLACGKAPGNDGIPS